MCWVMPPASPAATSVSRIASSSDVLPWSTWPMMVTTGGRDDEVLVGVVEGRLGVRLVGRADDLDLLVELVRQHLDGVVGERLGERGHLAQLHELLDDLRDGDAEVLRDVLDRRAGVDLDDVGLEDGDVLRHRLRVGAAPPPAAAPRRAPLRAAARTAAGAAARARRGRPCGARPASRSPRGARRRPRRGCARPAARSGSAGGCAPPPPGACRCAPAGRRALLLSPRRAGAARPAGGGRFVAGRSVTPSGGRAPRSRMPRSPRRARALRLGAAPFVARLLDLLARERGVGHRPGRPPWPPP